MPLFPWLTSVLLGEPPVTRTALTEMEIRIMTALQDTTTELVGLVDQLIDRLDGAPELQEKIDELVAAAEELARQEAAEDVEQSADLDAARAARAAAEEQLSSALSEMTTALPQLQSARDRARAALGNDAPDPGPVEEPVVTPQPAPEEPAVIDEQPVVDVPAETDPENPPAA